MIHQDLLDILEFVKKGKEAKLMADGGGHLTVKKTGVGKYTVKIIDNLGKKDDEIHLKYKGLLEMFEEFSKQRKLNL